MDHEIIPAIVMKPICWFLDFFLISLKLKKTHTSETFITTNK